MSFFSSKECVEREREGSERMFPFGGEKKRARRLLTDIGVAQVFE
jgi:hypothetical protein